MATDQNGAYIRVSRSSLNHADIEEGPGGYSGLPPPANGAPPPPHPHHYVHMPDTQGLYRLWDRFRGKGRNVPTVWQSIKNIAMCSSLNLFLVFIPIAWVAHYSYRIPHKGSHNEWSETLIFIFNFLAIVPLENLFDFGGEQMSIGPLIM